MPEGPNLVVNGGFETGNFFAWTYTDPEPDNPDIGVDNASEDVHSGSYGVFAGNEESTLSQSIATTVGHTYTVSFYLDVYQSAAYGGDFTATFGAVTGVNLHNAAETDGLNGFTQYSFTMTATSSNTLLEFTFLDPVGFYGLDDVSVNDNACYCAGTRVLTEDGERAVEDLAVGDLVVLASGETRPIQWIGRRKIALGRHPRPELVRPVRIEAGALGEKLPSRDLLVSPEHALWLEDRLVTAQSLINGATIRQEAWSHVEYFHVELDAHEILIAEGVLAESYLDCDNRSGFENAPGGSVTMHPDWSQRAANRPFASRAQETRLRKLYAARAAQRGRGAELEAYEARGQAPRSNFVLNPRAEGAIAGPIGQGGQAPHYWWLNAPEGIAIEIVAAGAERGTPFLELRLVGKSATAGHCAIYFQTGAAAAVARGELWTASCQLRVIEGAFDGIQSVNLYFDEIAADGAYLTGRAVRQPTPTSDLLALQRTAATYRISHAGAAAMTAYVQLPTFADVDVDLTLRIAAPQIELGDYASDLMAPPPGRLEISQRGDAAAIQRAA